MAAFLNTGCTNRSTFANVSISSPEGETRKINKVHCETQWFNLDGSIANRYRGCPERSHFPSTAQATSFGQGCATNEFNLILDAPNNNWSTADHQYCCGLQVHNSDALEEDETNRCEEDTRNPKFRNPLHGFHMCSTPSFHDGADKHQELDYSLLASIPSTVFSDSPIVPPIAKHSRINCSTKIYHSLSLEHLSQKETPHTYVISELIPFQNDRCRIHKNKTNASRFPQGCRKFEPSLQNHLAKSGLTAGCTYYRPNQIVWPDEKVNVASSLDETFVPEGGYPTTTKQWFRIIIVILICITVILCFGLRLNDWHRRYKLMQRYFVYVTKIPGDSDKVLFGEGQWPEDTDAVRDAGHIVDPVEKISSVESSKGMVLTLCNLNPIRGTSLFAVQNGSSIYDWILENQDNMLNGKEIRKPVKRTRTLVSLDLIRRTGLRIEEMLKFCRSDRYIYDAGNFSTILTHYGLCYFVEVEADVRNIHCVLDPHEYDYLIYGYNAVGFRIWIHFTKKQAIADLKIDEHSTYVDLHAADVQIEGIRPNEVIVGSDFDTVIRVVGNLQHRARCQTMTYPSCGLSYLGPENDVNEQDNVFKNKGTFKWQPENLHSGKIPNLPETSCLPYVLSALQLSKSSVYQKLLELKYPTMFQRNALAVSMGLRIQQRAYLRLANATAFEELRALLDEFGDLQNGLENISTQVYTIRRRLWSDEVKFSQRKSGEKRCVSDVPQHLRTLLNITNSFNEELCNLLFSGSFYGSYALSCAEKHWLAGYSTNSFTKHQTNTTTDYILDPSLNYLIKEDMDRCSRLELQILDMFFKNISPHPVLNELLRRHLRSLSAVRMQLRPGKVALPSTIAPLDVQHPRGIEVISTFSPTISCINELPESMLYAYDNELLELGENVASTLQRLDWFFNHMQEIAKENQAVINTFQLSHANLSQVPHTSLVSFSVQVERDASKMVAHSLSSLDNLLGTFSELLTTLLTTVGLLISILLLAERRFIGQRKHVNLRGQRSMVQKQTDN